MGFQLEREVPGERDDAALDGGVGAAARLREPRPAIEGCSRILPLRCRFMSGAAAWVKKDVLVRLKCPISSSVDRPEGRMNVMHQLTRAFSRAAASVT